MLDERLLSLLDAYRRRFQGASMLFGVLIASAAAGLVLVTAAASGAPPGLMRVTAAGMFAATGTLFGWMVWHAWDRQRVARTIEMRAGSLDNLVITAEEIASGRAKAPHAAVAEELAAAAIARLGAVPPAVVQPITRTAIAASLALVSVVALFMALPTAHRAPAVATASTDQNAVVGLNPGDLRVLVTPPTYARQRPSQLVNPTSVSVLEGSSVRLEVVAPAGDISLHELDGRAIPFAREADRAFLDIAARASRPLLVRQVTDSMGSDRLVHLRVEPDQRPGVAIREPAKDLLFGEGVGQVPVQIEARDDVGLETLALRYTRVSGSGETFTFEEGEWPITIEREGVASWRARGVFSLERLKLQDGDALVYRAVARDARPGADPAVSDTYLVEIGRAAGVASTGFALPEERDRQAISQQMLIIKTERLHADRGKLSREVLAEQAQLLAVEQRMVKAEFVFMTGGEVEDEVEEATHAHELAEGRLENTGQAELLTAIREMSRAEARLNAADTAQALTFERAALQALQRAFDRRRYLLRTLPERARIDISRRLTGALAEARSSAAGNGSSPADPYLQNARAILGELAARTGDPAPLAARMLALDPNRPALQQAALLLTAARDQAALDAAVRQAQQAIVDAARARLAVQGAPLLARDLLQGRLTQELSPRRAAP